MDAKVIVIMGSKADRGHAERVLAALREFGVGCELRVASAHKSTRHLLDVLAGYETGGGRRVYVAIAGRSNALAGMIDANVTAPVITCPPYSDKFGGADLFSSLRMPSGVAPLVVLEPEAAALAAVKILAVDDAELQERVAAYQAGLREQIVRDDEGLMMQRGVPGRSPDRPAAGAGDPA